MTIELIFSLIVFALCFWFIGSPLIKPKKVLDENWEEDEKKLNLDIQKESLMRSIKDIEMDFEFNKISKNDYDAMLEQTYQEGAKVVQELDKIGDKNEK